MTLSGKTAIVTGAGTGIGFAIANRLSAEGANVVVADILGEEAAAQSIVDRGLSAVSMHTDVASESNVQETVEKTVETFGGVDILVNNAAISATLALAAFEQSTVAEWRRILEVNTIGVFICCRAVSPHMRSQRYGRIINITSAMAFTGAPFLLHYAASKGAVMSMTRSLAREFGSDNITVNALSPGYTLTEGNVANTAVLARHRPAAIAGRALPRDALPEDIVGAAAFLASKDSQFVTGQILAVDGGFVYH